MTDLAQRPEQETRLKHVPAPSGRATAPLLEDIARRVQRRGTSFHMPGHKQAPPAGALLSELWGEGIFGVDLSEMGGLDYLHAPSGPLREAQRLAAELFGADTTFFLVNGSTAGNQAALLTTVRPGQKVLLARASHRSVYAALVLGGAVPVYVPPTYHPDVGLPLAIDATQAMALAAAHPDLAAIHVTSPCYYGYASDLRAFAAAAGRADVPLIVDEAHGAHFSFHPELPEPALQAGADISVQSVHKTLGSLTQSSMLHLRGNRVDRRQMQEVLAMLQSSSPSALLTASLDAARALMASSGTALLQQAVSLAEAARATIRGIPGLWCYGAELIGRGGVASYDPTKLLIEVSGLGVSGFEAARRLEDEWRVEVELRDASHVLCSITFADTADSLRHLVAALAGLAGTARGSPGAPGGTAADRGRRRAWRIMPGVPQLALPLREGYFAPSRPVPLRTAVSCISAESVIPYPPGVPALLPGEVIDTDMLEYLQALARDGARFVGVEDPTLTSLRVVQELDTGSPLRHVAAPGP